MGNSSSQARGCATDFFEGPQRVLELKAIEGAAVDAFFHHLNDASIAVMAGTVPHPITPDWVADRLARRLAEEEAGTAAQRGLFEDGVLVGDVSYFTDTHGHIQIGYAISRAHRGRGLASRAAALAIALVRDHGHTGPIRAGYAKDNPASGRVLAKLGFLPDGEDMVPSLGRGGDMPVWSVILRGDVHLRPVQDADLPALYRHQLDPDAYRLAAGGTLKADVATFAAHVRAAVAAGADFCTILHEGHVAGYLAAFDRDGVREISYWLGRAFRGQGIAARALRLFLDRAEVPADGFHARVALDHVASVRVLQKCGFAQVGTETGFSQNRGAEVQDGLFRWPAA